MRSPLALVEIQQHDPRTRISTREWAVVRTKEAARGMQAYRVVFVREPTPLERLDVEATLSHSAEPEPKVFDLGTLLTLLKASVLRPLGAILRGEP